VIVETVGVGQDEVDVAAATDNTVVVLAPRAGDPEQMAKAGIHEVSDVFVVNKGDRDGAGETARDLRQMLHMGAERPWMPPVLTTTATVREGLDEVWTAIAAHREHLSETGGHEAKRRRRLRREVESLAAERFRTRAAAAFDAEPGLEEDLAARRVDPYRAAAILGKRTATAD
jgi:LAO/AO transport system kinase